MRRATRLAVSERCRRSELRGLVRVVTRAGREDRFVLLAPLAKRPPGKRERPVALAVLPRGADQAHEPGRAGGGVQGEVELGVEAAGGPLVAAPMRRRVVVQEHTPALGVLVGEPHRRPADGQRLEREPRLVSVVQVLDRKLADPRTAVRDVHRETQALQLAHRLANRGDAHPERAGELLEAKRRPRRQLAR